MTIRAGAVIRVAWALVLSGLTASAAILYDRDGILLQGSASIVSQNAATCHVLEEKHSPEEYAKIKANNGQPLHVWQLDISAHNQTGKPLDFLRADFAINALHPPCSDWSGEGPGGGPTGDFVDTEGHPKPLELGNTLKVLSRVTGMGTGEAVRDTVFLVVFHQEQPVFKKWSVDFTFAQTRSQAPVAARSGENPPRANPRQRAQLPPEILVDRYLLRADRLMEAKDPKGALDLMGKIVALQKEHGLTLPEEFHFKHAKVALSAGEVQEAVDTVHTYLLEAGREGKFYREALELLEEAEQREQIQSWIGTQKTCVGQPKGTSCWMELTSQPDCYVWNGFLSPDATVTWTGECSGGRAQGEGTLKWVWEGGNKTSESTGSLTDGKRHGQWVLRFADGRVDEGPVVDGKQHGQWVWRYPDGTVQDVTFEDGEVVGRSSRR